MATKNDITGDKITNSKGDSDKHRDNWERIFGGKDMKEHVQQITGDTPHTVVEDAEKILDKLTRDNEDMGLYNND